jgi:hypothetical protein
LWRQAKAAVTDVAGDWRLLNDSGGGVTQQTVVTTVTVTVLATQTGSAWRLPVDLDDELMVNIVDC